MKTMLAVDKSQRSRNDMGRNMILLLTETDWYKTWTVNSTYEASIKELWSVFLNLIGLKSLMRSLWI